VKRLKEERKVKARHKKEGKIKGEKESRRNKIK